ncbi:MAG: right-handed parallel beta-helix repeat-containing protein [Planctomycetota bacterium]|nr:right-handed parallel beta-helix repeat-containing protein [Planctomycetota bacterium]
MRETILCAAAALCVSLAVLAGEHMQADFCVSPDGNDANPGTAAKPFATVGKAREAVRALVAAGLKKDVIVLIRAGVYELAEPLAFGPADSGTEANSIRYMVHPGEKAVLSGGRRITGWKRGEGNVWTAELPDVRAGKWFFRQLYVDDQRATRARFPNPGKWLVVKTCSSDCKVLTFNEALPAEDLGGKDVELLMLQNWSVSRALIASSDAKQLTSATPIGWIGHGAYTCASPGKPTCLENARVFLDLPGEWCLERATGTLSYMAKEGEDPNKLAIVAPRLENLVLVTGEKNKPVRNLRFEGLRFEHTEFPLPSFGYSECQAGHYGPNMKQPTHVPPVALEFMYAGDCKVEGGRIAHTGSAGVGFGAGCQRNTVCGCEITDIGGNGVIVGWRSKAKLQKGNEGSLDADWDDPTDAPVANAVLNNHITRCGTFSHGSVAVFAAFSADTKIAHNEIHDMPYTGVSVGFRWNTTPTSQCRCIVEHNHIYDVMKFLADGGGVYSLGLQPGTIMRGNLIHDVHRSGFAHGGAPNNGFFVDEGSKGFLFEENVVYGTSGDPVRFNNCQRDYHTWKDNCLGIRVAAKGKVGSGLSCDGSTTFVEVPHAADLEPEQLTVEAWINMPEFPGGGDARRWIVNKNKNEWEPGHYALMIDGDKAGAFANIGGGEKNSFAAWSEKGLLKLNQWQHLAMTYDGVTLKVYLDGKPVAATAVNKPRVPGHLPLAIARRQDGFVTFKGIIDEVGLYSRALPEAEIAEHVAKPAEVASAKGGGIVRRWSFDEEVKNNDTVERIKAQAGLEEPYRKLLLEQK